MVGVKHLSAAAKGLCANVVGFMSLSGGGFLSTMMEIDMLTR